MIDEISPVLNMCPDVANTDWFYISHVERDATTVQTCEQYKALLGFGAGSFPRCVDPPPDPSAPPPPPLLTPIPQNPRAGSRA